MLIDATNIARLHLLIPSRMNEFRNEFCKYAYSYLYFAIGVGNR